ncbi:MAG: PAS domain-containing protein [Methanoregula sp.]|nr:PAS domain-containing protein [Methanoregula sp.]
MPVVIKGDSMDIGGRVNDEILYLFIVTSVTIGAILSSIFSVSHGIFDVFPFMYILAIILIVYFYPKYGVLYSLGIGLVYIGLVFSYGTSNPIQIAISSAWFVIFIAIGVVASSYANRLRDDKRKIRNVFENAQDGIFCFEIRSLRILDINPKCARMLQYGRDDLIGKEIASIWMSEVEREAFISGIKDGKGAFQKEVLLRAKDGTPRRCLVSAILSTNRVVLCSAIDITQEKTADEEIRLTLEELDRQVRERTAHLEKINDDLKAEILEHKMDENALLFGEQNSDRLEGMR